MRQGDSWSFRVQWGFFLSLSTGWNSSLRWAIRNHLFSVSLVTATCYISLQRYFKGNVVQLHVVTLEQKRSQLVMQSSQHRCFVEHWELKSNQYSCKISLSLSNRFILSDTKQKNDMTYTRTMLSIDSTPRHWQNIAVPVRWFKGKSNQEWSIRLLPPPTRWHFASTVDDNLSKLVCKEKGNRAAVAAERGGEMKMRGRKTELVIWERMRGEESTRWAENRFFTISVCEITMSAELQ